jgi:hypothetical protein
MVVPVNKSVAQMVSRRGDNHNGNQEHQPESDHFVKMTE